MGSLKPWICLIFIVLMAINANATSLAQQVFLPSDSSLNPFSDSFIQRVSNMDRDKLHRILQTNDNEYVLKLLQNNGISHGSLVRTGTVIDYESIFDDKLDDQLTLQDSIDGEWVHLMTAGPLTVNYVGNLLVLASRRDFPLTRPPNFPFRHIKNPDSFRATLAQVSGSIYSALLGAHTTMDHIQLNVQKVPNQVKTVLQLILGGSPTLIKIILPKTLESISQIANESAAQARVTFNKFSLLQELIAEIIEASTNTHSTKTAVVDQIHSEINRTRLEQEQLETNINNIKIQYENARQELEKARKEHQDAYKAIPNLRFFRRIFRAVARFVKNVFMAPLRILGCILGLCYNDRAAFETARQNAIAKANLLRQVLEDAEKRHDAFVAQQAAEQKNLENIMDKLAALDFDRMSEQEIVDILIDCVVQMGQIKEQWGRLIQFFSKLSIQADSTQQIVIHELVGMINDIQAQNLLIDPVDREFFADILSVTCQEVERGAHLLYVMSKTYSDISSEYMVDQITSVNTLLLLQTNSERTAHIRALSSNTTSISAQIVQLAQKRQNEYTRRNKARREEFEKFLAKVAQEELDISVDLIHFD